MIVTEDLESVESHYQFGANWASYSGLVDTERVEAARVELARLLGTNDVSGQGSWISGADPAYIWSLAP